MREVSAFISAELTSLLSWAYFPFGLIYGDPGQLQLQNRLGMFPACTLTPQARGQKRRDSACQWFATKWRTRAAEIGVQGAARLMRKQGVPCDVAVSILATR